MLGRGFGRDAGAWLGYGCRGVARIGMLGRG